MVNIIWGLFIVVGIIYAFINGNTEIINNTILQSGREGFDLVLTILPILVIWMGLMKIAEKSGLLVKISNFLGIFFNKLFPSVPKDNPALGLIASNIAINMMGLGSAATPFGLKAMEELQKINDKKDEASDAMITFLVLNTSAVTIVPTTVISMRLISGSNDPSIIILPCILATFISAIFGLGLDYILRRKNK